MPNFPDLVCSVNTQVAVNDNLFGRMARAIQNAGDSDGPADAHYRFSYEAWQFAKHTHAKREALSRDRAKDSQSQKSNDAQSHDARRERRPTSASAGDII
jgi:hypothetical protein